MANDLEFLRSLVTRTKREEESLYEKNLRIVGDDSLTLEKRADAIRETIMAIGAKGYDLFYSLHLRDAVDLLFFQLPDYHDLLRAGAEAKHPECCYLMGRLYGVMGLPSTALGFLKRGTKSKDPEGRYYYAQTFLVPEYGQMDIEKGLALMGEAAEKGSKKAAWYLGEGYLEGKKEFKGRRDAAKAVTYLEWGTKAGDPECEYLLARIRLGKIKKAPKSLIDKSEGIDHIVALARRGEVEALREMGSFYLGEEGFERSVYVAAGYFREAATKGDAYSCLLTGVMSLLGVEKLPEGMTLDYFEKALVCEDPKIRKAALSGIRSMFESGIEAEQDEAVALALKEVDTENRPDFESRDDLYHEVNRIIKSGGKNGKEVC